MNNFWGGGDARWEIKYGDSMGIVAGRYGSKRIAVWLGFLTRVFKHDSKRL
jgi:hypothetical protein